MNKRLSDTQEIFYRCQAATRGIRTEGYEDE
jgi:hypothetical protein